MSIKKISILVFFSLALFSSCGNEENDIMPTTVKVEKSFTVSNDAPTRAYISYFDRNEGNVGIRWTNDTENEKISVFAEGHEGVKGDVFKFSGYGTPQSNAKFTGETFQDATTFHILYPAQENARIFKEGTDEYMSYNIPHVQKAIDGTFDPAACIQLGKGSASSTLLSLKHVCAFFYLTVAPGCNKIEVEALDNNWHLAGDVTSKISSASTAITSFGANTHSKISLKDIPENGGTFFIAFIPSTVTGSKIEVTIGGYSAADIILRLQANQQFVSGGFYDLGTYPATGI